MKRAHDLEGSICNVKDLSRILHLWLSDTHKDEVWDKLGPAIALARTVAQEADNAAEDFYASLKGGKP